MAMPGRFLSQENTMYDLIILGGGPAGYVAAEHAGRMGKKTVLVEKDRIGGTCLNSGCIPTKSYLHSAKTYDHALSSAVFGVQVQSASFDFDAMKTRTGAVQDTLRNGILGMMKKGKVEVVAGSGVVVDKNTVAVGDNEYKGANLLLCTGSRPAWPPIPGLSENPCVVDSTGMLERNAPADNLVVIGGGVIGLEFAFFHALLGKKVTVLEMLPQIAGAVDRDIAMTIQRKLESKGALVQTGAKVEKVDGNTVFYTDKQGQNLSVQADCILIAAGRVNNIENIGLEKITLDMDAKRIKVNDRGATNIPGVYAAGDITGIYQLAHFASRQATVAVRAMFGEKDICRTDAVPAVIYTDPEIATVGITEDAMKTRGIQGRVVKMPLGASGRWLAETNGERGFVKAVLGERNVLLGMHVVGPYASEMIGAACVMIENEMRAEDIREVIFPHPTVSEIMKEVMYL